MAALAMVLVVVTAVTLAVGLLGFVRIRKDRPSLKSYELEVPSPGGSMGCDGARTPASKTDEPETVSMDTDESHMRARAGEARRQDGDDASLLRRLGTLLWQFTGIPLLAGHAAPPDTHPTATHIDTAAMGNTAAPTRTLLSGASSLHSPTATSTKSLSAEVDALRDSKVATPSAGPSEAASADRLWSDDDESNASAYASSEEEDDDTATESQQTDEEKFEELRAHIMMDGLQFYTAVASVSVATVSHAVDIALFRATTIVLRERRKAHEEASIHAIETLYPDIMCLPPNANVRYAAGPLKPAESSLAAAHATVAATMSPRTTTRQLETGFLKAA